MSSEEQITMEEERITMDENKQEIFLKKFNKTFEEEQEKIRDKKIKNIKVNKKKVKNIHDLTLGEILVNTKNTYMGIIADLLLGNFDKGIINVFTKEDRIFYIGVSLLIISFLIYIISFLINDTPKISNTEKLNSGININIMSSPKKISTNNKIKPNIKEPELNTIETSSVDTEVSNKLKNLNLSNKIDTSDLKEIEL